MEDPADTPTQYDDRQGQTSYKETRPSRQRLATTSQLCLDFEGWCSHLETLVSNVISTGTSQAALTYSLDEIDVLHTKLFSCFVDLKRSLKNKGAVNELQSYTDQMEDLDEKIQFATKKLNARSEKMDNSSRHTSSIKSVVLNPQADPNADTCQTNFTTSQDHRMTNVVHILPEVRFNEVPPCELMSPKENMSRFFGKMPREDSGDNDNRRHCPTFIENVVPLNPTVPPFVSNSNEEILSSHSQAIVPHLLIKKEAFTVPKQPYNGNALDYKHWEMKMKRFVAQFRLSAYETIDLLEVHTTGQALQIISRFKDAAGFNPDQAVQKLWKELATKFGSPASQAKALQDKLNSLPSIVTVMTKLSEFHNECEIVLLHMDYISDLSVLNYTQGLAPLFLKLPQFIRNKWQSVVFKHSQTSGKHPPFAEFCKFLSEQVQTFANSLSAYGPNTDMTKVLKEKKILKSDASRSQANCALHKTRSNHVLADCREFLKLDVPGRHDIVKEQRLCFRCLGNHFSKDCQADATCKECRSQRHHSLLSC